MKIDFVEIGNFRKLRSTRVGFSSLAIRRGSQRNSSSARIQAMLLTSASLHRYGISAG